MSGERARIVPLLVALAALAMPVARSQPSPTRLQDVVEEVRRMRARGDSNGDISRYVTRVVHDRLNAQEAPAPAGWPPPGYTYNTSRWARDARYQEQRETPVAQGSFPGREYAFRAHWAWNASYGQSPEAAAVTYFILHEAGIDARLIEIAGHSFTAFGLAPGADPEDMSTWGADAHVPDGWLNESLGATAARDHPFIRGRSLTDQTRRYDDREGFDRAEGSAYSRSLVVTVVRAANGEPVPGAAVRVSGASGSGQLSSGAGGRADWPTIGSGPYSVEVIPPRDSGLRDASATVDVQQVPTELTVRLADAATEPVDLVVHVFGADGNRLPGATVTSLRSGSATTNEAGTVVLRSTPGEERVTATKDGVGSSSAAIQIERFFTESVVLALGVPEVAITAPADASSVTEPRVTVSGTVTNGEGIETVEVAVNGAATSVPVQGGAFATSVTLAEGPNTITATAPAAGEAVVIVRYLPLPPVPVTAADPWVGRFRGQGRTTCVESGEQARGNDRFPVEAAIRRLGPTQVELTLTVRGASAPRTLDQTPSNPNAARAASDQTQVAGGAPVRTVVETTAFLQNGQLHIAERTSYTVQSKQAAGNVSCEAIMLLDPVP